ncbi:hypothetical protein ZIOFF_072812 [Zingiber officinale]|uniref:Splicing factor U2af large subunit n=1 Tax=Zingiber officinale TaxID=94328 RepID=A0A8J5ESF3_ZINOF|nr:hypothetical protein ZIOFF_072812 [Zingiber officinale]
MIRSKRTSGFDMAPPIASGLPEPTATGSLPVVPQLMSGTLPTMLPITASQFGPLGLMPAQAVAQQATRHARRIYVGGLPPMANEQGEFIVPLVSHHHTDTDIDTSPSRAMRALVRPREGLVKPHDRVRSTPVIPKGEAKNRHGNRAIAMLLDARGPRESWGRRIGREETWPEVLYALEKRKRGDAVVNVYINHEKKFAFVEMRSVEEASNAMSLDGIIFEGVSVKVRRPTDYNASLAAALGPSQPSPHLNLAAVGLSSSNTIMGSEGPDRIFVGGLPYYFADAQIRELLESFGPLRGLDLVKDRDTGNSKGYGFCVYQDPSVTDIACAALNGLKMGEKTLTVRRATASMGQMKPEQELILQQAHEHIAMQKLAFKSGGISPFPEAGSVVNAAVELPTKVICLTEVVSVDELRDDAEYKEIVEDMREESEKFGSLINLVIPRPSQTGEMIPGVGKVFLEYANIADSARAKVALHGRRFGENVVCAAYYPEEKFSSGDYDTIVVV